MAAIVTPTTVTPIIAKKSGLTFIYTTLSKVDDKTKVDAAISASTSASSSAGASSIPSASSSTGASSSKITNKQEALDDKAEVDNKTKIDDKKKSDQVPDRNPEISFEKICRQIENASNYSFKCSAVGPLYQITETALSKSLCFGEAAEALLNELTMAECFAEHQEFLKKAKPPLSHSIYKRLEISTNDYRVYEYRGGRQQFFIFVYKQGEETLKIFQQNFDYGVLEKCDMIFEAGLIQGAIRILDKESIKEQKQTKQPAFVPLFIPSAKPIPSEAHGSDEDDFDEDEIEPGNKKVSANFKY